MEDIKGKIQVQVIELTVAELPVASSASGIVSLSRAS